jgi:hypothetical protein
LITAADMALAQRPPAMRRLPAAAPLYVPAAAAAATPLRERLLLFVLYITVLASSAVFIEPSPHDALMGVLAVACVAAGVRFDARILPMFLFLLIWNVSGLMSLINVVGEQKTVQYSATSIYLAVAALIWACLCLDNTMTRLAAIRSAYILTAVLVALAGIVGYFDVIPGTRALFAPDARALGTFKDPNVFGPFLIWPALVILERMLTRRAGFVDLVTVGVLMLGLLLAFSRGAWFHFALSCLVMIALSLLTAQTRSRRLRIVVLSALTVAAIALFVAILLTLPAIESMFRERAQILQSYDVGQSGRFRLQEIALSALLNAPNGLGPFGFASRHANQQHNVYLQAFLVYGWVGGVAYVLLLLTTFWVALRSVFVPTPWQPYLVATLAAFTGAVAEGFIIDTDHWRHFYLLVGLIWGLWAATARDRRRFYAPQPALPAGSY